MKNKFWGLLIGVCLVFTSALPVGAWTATSYYQLGMDGDWWYNYDSTSGDWNLTADEVDWPVTMVWYGYANVSDIRQMLWGEAWADSNMRMIVYDGGYTYDEDKGSKWSINWPDGVHTRLYAQNGAASYCATLGYYVIGTTHWDNLPNFGWSETATYDTTLEDVTTEAAETVGWNNIQLDSLYMYNYEQSRFEDFWRYIKNDGWADLVYVPA